MKRFSKLLSLLLAVTLLACLAVPVMANTSKITIEGAQIGDTYYAYKLLDVTYSSDGAYTYYKMKVPEGQTDTDIKKWNDFLDKEEDGYLIFETVGKERIASWNPDKDVEEFAKDAWDYAVNNGIQADESVTATGTTAELTVSTDGYYLVTSSRGSKAFVHTVDPNATITEKNEAPTLDLKVWEEHEKKTSSETPTGEWVEFNRVEAGEILTYKIEVPVKDGALNYVVHDAMDPTHNHLSLVLRSTKVYVRDSEGRETLLESGYSIKRYDAEGKDVTEDNNATVSSFDVVFNNATLTPLAGAGNVLVIKFNANFVGSVEAVEHSPHSNTAYLKYGVDTENPSKTVEAKVETASYALDLLKYAGQNMSKPLADAQFKIHRIKETESGVDVYNDPVHFHIVKTYDDQATGTDDKTSNKGNIYTVCNIAHGTDSAPDSTEVITTPANGTCLIYGLDTETYYIEEIKAPAGYNPLAAPVEVALEVNHMSQNRIYDLNISNNSGSILPDTGGIGTTIFYILGGVMVLGAAVLLITKKRMAAEE